ncbi:unnamed protein product [Prunus armeniaca]|uniref:Uncharacterized protein n=1 Tax=Prunus armeniaca TaxID=36596 RepID=A0A6J5W443_PRUAR|nr:unnamed protein product [Prunus armeniaca]
MPFRSLRGYSTSVLKELCEKWCPVFSLDTFTVRIKASKRSESMDNGLPYRAAIKSGLLLHAANIYIIKKIKLFETKVIDSLAVRMCQIGNDGTLQTFELKEEGRKRVHRWTKEAKKGWDANEHGESLQVSDKSSVTLRPNSLMRMAYDILSKEAKTDNTNRIAMQKLKEME